MYIDNVLLRDASTLPTDYFRTKNSGNWSDAVTWESSFNNANWVSAISSPGNTASNTEINTGYNVTVDENVNTTDLTLNPGTKLTLNSGFVLNTSTINLQSDETNGTATFVDNGTFSANNVFVQQYLTGGRNWYLSSPVSTASSSDFSSAETVYSYNETNGSWDAENASLIPMKGYISAATTGDGVITLNGTLNTGNQSILLSRSTTNTTKPGFNLVGNPYPSYVNWELAAKTDLNNTIWYRTQNTNGTYVFDTFNGVGTNNNESGEVTKYIPPFQAFWVRVNEGSSNGTLAFENSMRSHENGTNRLKAPAQNSTDQQVVRLQVSNGTNKDETIILFNESASDEFDSFDSPKMTNANIRIPEIFTTIGTVNLVINGMKKFSENNELPLGFTTGESNTFTLKITEVKNLSPDTRIILKDKILNTETDLTDGTAYNFSSGIVNNSTRFSVMFKTQTSTTQVNKIENPSKENVVFLNSENHLVINRNMENSKDNVISIFNISGQKIYNSVMNGKSVIIEQKFNQGTYLVKVGSSDNYYTTKITIN